MPQANLHRARPSTAAYVAGVGLALAGAASWGQPIAVTVAAAQYREFALFSTQPATAEAFHEADLGAKVSGHVSELLVDIGTPVTSGQVLARLAVPELTQARNASVAFVTALRSEHERTVMLAERNSVTQRALTEARGRLDAAIAEQAEIEARMDFATIRAPFDGVVTARTIDPGDMVYEANSPKGSDQPLLRVAKLDVIRVKTYVPERESVWADVGDPATITFDALPGLAFMGQVARVSGTLDPGTRTMLVEIDLPNDDGRIRPGLYGQTQLLLERRERALALPVASVRFDTGGAFVYIVGDGDTARRNAVQVGLRDGQWIEIVGGLSETERVVSSGVGILEENQPLRIVQR